MACPDIVNKCTCLYVSNSIAFFISCWILICYLLSCVVVNWLDSVFPLSAVSQRRHVLKEVSDDVCFLQNAQQ